MNSAPLLRRCDICGEPFAARNGMRRTCSVSCSDALARARLAQRYATARGRAITSTATRPKREIACRHCGELFVPRGGRQVICSREPCRRAYRQALYRRRCTPKHTSSASARRASASRRPIMAPNWPAILAEARAELAAWSPDFRTAILGRDPLDLLSRLT